MVLDISFGSKNPSKAENDYLNTLRMKSAALLACADAWERAQWRRIAEAPQDGGVLLLHLPTGDIDYFPVPPLTVWADESNGFTHFAQLPALSDETAAQLRGEVA